MQKPVKIRARQWHQRPNLTVWLEAAPMNDADSQTFLVSLEEGDPHIGKIVGRMTRKDGDRRVRNPNRTPKVQLLWTYALNGEYPSQYTKMDSRAAAIRAVILADEQKQRDGRG